MQVPGNLSVHAAHALSIICKMACCAKAWPKDTVMFTCEGVKAEHGRTAAAAMTATPPSGEVDAFATEHACVKPFYSAKMLCVKPRL